MKALYLAAGLVLATATSAAATETFPDSAMSNGLSSVSADAKSMLGDCLSDESSSRAVRACTKAIRASVPNDDIRAHLYSRRALHRMALGRYDSAANDFARAGDLKNDETLTALGEGFTAMMRNDLTMAKARFEDCGHRGQVAPLAQYGLGLTYQMAGEERKALDAYQRALDLRPGWTAVAEQAATLQD